MTTKHIGIRLDEEYIQELQKLGNLKNQTPNQIAKIAIIEWIQNQWTRDSDFITIPKDNFAFMLNIMTETQVNEYLDKIAKSILRYFEFFTHKQTQTLDLQTYIDSMLQFIGRTGMMWLDKIDYEIKENSAHISGTHKMGKVWSEIFVKLNEKLLIDGNFPFTINNNSKFITSSTIFLEYLRK